MTADEKKTAEKKPDEQKPEEKKEEKPTLEKLLQFNSQTIFGGEVKIEGDVFTLEYKKGSQFPATFEGQGVLDPGLLKTGGEKQILERAGGAVKKIADKEVKVGAVAVVGRGDGDWQTRFPLSGEIHFEFKLYISGIQPGSVFVVRMNKSSDNAIQTAFFQNVVVTVGGKPLRRVVGPKEYQGPPEKWFDRKGLMSVSMVYKDGKLTAKVDGKDAFTVDAPETPAGKLGISFRKLTFCLGEVKVSGKIDRSWCEERVKELEAKQLLVTREPAGPKALQPRRAAKTPEELKAERRKEAEQDL